MRRKLKLKDKEKCLFGMAAFSMQICIAAWCCWTKVTKVTKVTGVLAILACIFREKNNFSCSLKAAWWLWACLVSPYFLITMRGRKVKEQYVQRFFPCPFL